MDWLRSTPRYVYWLLLLLGSATAPAARAAPPEAGLAAARQSLRARLTAPDADLGLAAGPVVRVFYARHDYAPRWIQESGWNRPAREALQVLARAAEVGLDRQRYNWSALQTLSDSLPRMRAAGRGPLLATAELRLTDALLRYLHHVQRGQLQPGTLGPAAAPDSTQAELLADQLHAVLAAPSLPAALLRYRPAGRGYRLLQAAWQQALHTSPADSARLMQDTVAGFRRVALNLERLRWQAPADSEYAVVNIPAYRLQVVCNGQVVQTHRVIVGKPETPTPVLTSRMVVFVVAPEWRVPYSIAVREFLPELQRDPGYLYDHHYRLYDARGQLRNPWRVNWQRVTPERFPYTIRQRAGAFNALGSVVFYFPNQQTVFLHDTPGRSAFAQPGRALSHGCVRVEKPLKLAEYLLRREGRTRELPLLYQHVRAHEKLRVDLQHSLPIYLGYFTCEADNGRLLFLPDIYQQDAALARALELK